MESRGLERKQKLVLGAMAGALLGVLAVLGALLRQDAPASPLATLAMPAVARQTATAARPSPTPLSPTPQPPTLTPAPTRIQAPPEVLASRRIQSLVENVGQVRELPKQQEIVFNFLNEQELAAYLRRALADVERQIFVQRQHTLLAALKLLPAPGQTFAPSVQARARRVIAFYDLDEAQIFVGPAGRSSDPPDASLVHQYAQALIDQHFDLAALVGGGTNGDARRARDALLEGDATAVMAIHSFGGLSQADADALAEHLFDVELSDYEGYPTPRAMRQVFVFPYRDGMRFVAALLQANWWPDVNAAYLDPPVSTEQILHPEKYINAPRDEPRAVNLPNLGAGLDDGWRRVSQDVLGELLLRAHLDHYLPSVQAQAAAAGWDGDLAAVWRDDWAAPEDRPREILVLRTVWDSVEEANEFVYGYVDLIERRLHDASRVRRASMPRGGRWWRGIEGDAFLQQTGYDVLIIWTPDTEAMELALAALESGDSIPSNEQGVESGEQVIEDGIMGDVRVE
jgi:hypothetical protein